MTERDSLQLIDLEAVNAIMQNDAEGVYAFVEGNFDRFKAMERSDSFFHYFAGKGMDEFRTGFYRNWAQDDGLLCQCLVNDLAFFGERVYLDFWARSAYLDSPLSAHVRTSDSFIPRWPKHTEVHAYWRLFDLLEAPHVRLMVEGMKKNQRQIDPDKYTDYLKLELFASAVEASPKICAAYIWDFRDHY